MPLKQKLTAAEYSTLGDTDKKNYKLVGADYVPDVEGVENLAGLVTAYNTVKGEKETATTQLAATQAQLKQFEGVDLDKYRQLVGADQSAQLGKLTDKGQYDKALETVNTTHEAERKKLQDKLDAQAVDHSLTLALSAAGVIPERLQDALQIARPLVGVVDGAVAARGTDGNVNPALKLDGWTGDAFKKGREYLFKPNGNGGSGAHNETQTGATGDKPTKTRAEANTLPPVEKMAFMEQVSQGKAVLTD